MPPIENPLTFVFPEIIETERLLIRPPQTGDGPIVNEAIRESIEHLRPWMPWAQTKPTVEENEMFCRTKQAEYITREDLLMFIFERGSGRFIGGTGLHRIDWSVPRFEIGYWIRKSAEGWGYVTDAVNALTDFAFIHLQAERVEILCESTNKRSITVAQRCGFTHEGTFRNFDRTAPGEALRDLQVHGMIRSDWEQARHDGHW